MLDKDVMEIVEDLSPGFYSHIVLVEEASGGWRLVISLSLSSERVYSADFI